MTKSNHSWPVASERTLGAILRRQARVTAHKRFAVFPDRSWAFGELDTWVDRLAHGLISLGVKKGAKVALMLPNCSEFLGIWFACARIGAVEVPINTNIRGHLLRHVLHHSDAILLVTLPDYLESLKAVIDDLPQLETIVFSGEISNRDGFGSKRLRRFEVLESKDYTPIDLPIDPADPVAIIFTSGTTGPSKGAVLTHNYFWWFGERCDEFIQKWYPGANRHDRNVAVGVAVAQTLVQVLKLCGEDLSRENVMRQAASIRDFDLGMLLPGIKVNTDKSDFYPIEQMQIMRFEGDNWKLSGIVVGGEAERKESN
jgi:acyl-CoA synthetase (AMP-forming)/AMP-acid ligase II